MVHIPFAFALILLAGQQSSAMRKLGKDVKTSSSSDDMGGKGGKGQAHDETLRDYHDMGGKGGKGAPSPSPPAYVACEHIEKGTPKDNKDTTVPTSTEYDEAVDKLDMKAVKEDMAKLLKNSDPCWPADQGNYAGLMARLAWHCSGSYRKQDGVGGCMGGRQRFEPERSWPDNTNLDKARALLYPLKKKYGAALSWGDLIILAGTTAYREAGMPVARMCFGRQDEQDGTTALLLGPTKQQEENFPCLDENKQPTDNGKCSHPLPTTVGLVYVNPEGPMRNPDPKLSVAEIRRTFDTMGHSDVATVALIGGGHAIGGSHGACAGSPGNAPKDAFEKGTDVWKGECGSGIGTDTYTSGIEGYWTTKPFTWDNEFFKYLLDKEWELWEGPGKHQQWRVKGETGGGVMRMTSDMALLEDESYLEIVKNFSNDMYALNTAFDAAWDKLTSRGKGVWSSNAKCDDGSTPPTTVSAMRSDDAEHIM